MLQVAARYTNAHAIVNLSVRFSAPEPTTLHAASFPEMRIALGYPHPDKLGQRPPCFTPIASLLSSRQQVALFDVPPWLNRGITFCVREGLYWNALTQSPFGSHRLLCMSSSETSMPPVVSNMNICVVVLTWCI